VSDYSQAPTSTFVAGTETDIWLGTAGTLATLLRTQHLYKSLSLLLANIAGINIPPSLLLLSLRPELIEAFAGVWGTPLMIRVDFTSRSKAKPIGGIPIYDLGKWSMYQKTC